jgi:hypothetical protein
MEYGPWLANLASIFLFAELLDGDTLVRGL